MSRKLFFLIIICLFLYVASPLLIPVLMGGIFAVLCFPLLEYLEKKKFGTGLASTLITLGITLLFILPSAFVIFLAAKTGLQQLKHLKDAPRTVNADFFGNLVQQPWVNSIVEKITVILPVEPMDLVVAFEDITRAVALRTGELLGGFFASLPGMLIALAIIIVSIFFFLVDGRQLAKFIRSNSFFNPSQTDQLLKTFTGMCRSVILASVASGTAQAALETLALVLTGTPNILLIAFLVLITSLLPLVGSAPITIGVAIHQLLLGRTTAGIVLLFAAGAVAIVDNLVRPMVLKGASNLHPLLAFVAAFGGLQTIGFSGVFLGPIMAGLFVVTLQILTHHGHMGPVQKVTSD